MRKTKIVPIKERCSETIWDGPWRTACCSRRGTITEDGKLYCKQHAPTLRAAKRAQQAKASDLRWADQTRISRISSARRSAAYAMLALAEASEALPEDFQKILDQLGVECRDAEARYRARVEKIEGQGR